MRTKTLGEAKSIQEITYDLDMYKRKRKSY